MVRCFHDDIIRPYRHNRISVFQNELLATVTTPCDILLGTGIQALSKRLRHAPRGKRAVPSRLAARAALSGNGVGISLSAEPPRRRRAPPEGLGKGGRQDRYVGRDDADDGLAHAPAVDVDGARVGPDGEDDPDDCCRYDEEACADEHADEEFLLDRNSELPQDRKGYSQDSHISSRNRLARAF